MTVWSEGVRGYGLGGEGLGFLVWIKAKESSVGFVAHGIGKRHDFLRLNTPPSKERYGALQWCCRWKKATPENGWRGLLSARSGSLRLLGVLGFRGLGSKI